MSFSDGGADSQAKISEKEATVEMSSSDGGLEPQAKIPKKEATPEEFSVLLAQPREIVLQIVNYLDPKSFLKLASTCRYLLNFCQNAKGIHVVYKLPHLRVKNDRNGNICYNYWFPRHQNLEKTRKYIEQLRKWPFSICFDEMRIFALNRNVTWDRLYEEIKAHLLTIGAKKIRLFSRWRPPINTAHDMEYLTKFVKTFYIESVFLDEPVPEGAFEACLKLPVLELCIVSRDRGPNFNVDSVLQCSIPILFYPVNINREQFGKILEMWKTKNGLKRWGFYYRPDINIMGYFDDWEILSFTSAGPIDPKLPLVFMDGHDDYNEKKFYLLREDGKVMRFLLHTGHKQVELNICPASEAPPGLRAL